MAKFTNMKWDNIDHSDYPDYCDAYLVSCDINGMPANEDEIELINNMSDLRYELLMEYLT